jgi:hypothetical protein
MHYTINGNFLKEKMLNVCIKNEKNNIDIKNNLEKEFSLLQEQHIINYNNNSNNKTLELKDYSGPVNNETDVNNYQNVVESFINITSNNNSLELIKSGKLVNSQLIIIFENFYNNDNNYNNKQNKINLNNDIITINNLILYKLKSENNTFTFVSNSIKEIGDNTFEEIIHLKSIIIPKSVYSIGSNAFRACINLNSVLFGSNSNLSIIKRNAFNGCINLKNLVIPKSINLIGKYAFLNCFKLESIVFLNNIPILEDNEPIVNGTTTGYIRNELIKNSILKLSKFIFCIKNITLNNIVNLNNKLLSGNYYVLTKNGNSFNSIIDIKGNDTGINTDVNTSGNTLVLLQNNIIIGSCTFYQVFPIYGGINIKVV